MGYFRPLASEFRPDFLEAQENRHLGVDSAFCHAACTDEVGLSGKDTEIRAYPIGPI